MPGPVGDHLGGVGLGPPSGRRAAPSGSSAPGGGRVQHGAVGDPAHRDVDDGRPVVARAAPGRAGSCRAAAARRRDATIRGVEVAVSRHTRPRRATRSANQPSRPVGKQRPTTTSRAPVGRRVGLVVERLGQRDVADRAAAVPAGQALAALARAAAGPRARGRGSPRASACARRRASAAPRSSASRKWSVMSAAARVGEPERERARMQRQLQPVDGNVRHARDATTIPRPWRAHGKRCSTPARATPPSPRPAESRPRAVLAPAREPLAAAAGR